ncbi:hypothetical protein GCM10025776_27340 [Corallincola platygyrae]
MQLDDNNLCQLFGDPRRPQVCLKFMPCPDVCGDNDEIALINLTELEQLTD